MPKKAGHFSNLGCKKDELSVTTKGAINLKTRYSEVDDKVKIKMF